MKVQEQQYLINQEMETMEFEETKILIREYIVESLNDDGEQNNDK